MYICLCLYIYICLCLCIYIHIYIILYGERGFLTISGGIKVDLNSLNIRRWNLENHTIDLLLGNFQLQNIRRALALKPPAL